MLRSDRHSWKSDQLPAGKRPASNWKIAAASAGTLSHSPERVKPFAADDVSLTKRPMQPFMLSFEPDANGTCLFPAIFTRGEKMTFVKVLIFASAVAGTFLPLTGIASAQIVALGASNTEGYGVNPSEAWPAQLESMLRAKGSGAHITNAGVYGDTTGQVLARLSSAVPDGTKVVILDIGPFNDERTGGSVA